MTKLLTPYVDEMDSPLGILTIVVTDQGICQLLFGDYKQNMATVHAWLKKHGRNVDICRSKKKTQQARKQLDEYFSGKRFSFDLPLDLSGTVFQKKVWNVLANIQYGETKTYKQIAEEIGAPKAVRAVGGANNQNPIPIIIPCHRVIGSSGNMVGYGGGLDKKEYLLQLEGAIRKIS